jgi:hypothetical protein
MMKDKDQGCRIGNSDVAEGTVVEDRDQWWRLGASGGE